MPTRNQRTAQKAISIVDRDHLFCRKLAHFICPVFGPVRMPLAHLAPVHSFDLFLRAGCGYSQGLTGAEPGHWMNCVVAAFALISVCMPFLWCTVLRPLGRISNRLPPTGVVAYSIRGGASRREELRIQRTIVDETPGSDAIAAVQTPPPACPCRFRIWKPLDQRVRLRLNMRATVTKLTSSLRGC